MLRLGANTIVAIEPTILLIESVTVRAELGANKEKNNVSAQVQFKHKLLVVSYHSS